VYIYATSHLIHIAMATINSSQNRYDAATAIDLLNHTLCLTDTGLNKTTEQLRKMNYPAPHDAEMLCREEEISTKYTCKPIIGAGPAMQKVFHAIDQVAATNSTVLLLGETGTGKELIAHAIHHSSRRKEKAMIKVNCAALPASLIESELFGHERGSFTGATDRRLGKFEQANHGTLFLDEIGEMPLELQVKLLRALQEKEIERVGGRKTIRVDVRIIAATNRNLQTEMAEGRFRADLFYRLNVFPVTMPALRTHKEDIPALTAHFLRKHTANIGRNIRKVSAAAMKELMAYSWPGNIRELEHLMERSVLVTSGDTIAEFNLPALHTITVTPHSGTTIKTYEDNERDHIIAALHYCNGKIYGTGGAAQVLNLKVSTLNSMIRRLGITKETINRPIK
jgi:formate hydrogenlyase transcriptional activator